MAAPIIASQIIASRVVPSGTLVLGPYLVADKWSQLNLVLDVANLASMDVLCEFSLDGVTWRTLVTEKGLSPALNVLTGLPQTSYNLSANWTPPLPAGQVRATITNATAFLSGGGSLTVT